MLSYPRMPLALHHDPFSNVEIDLRALADQLSLCRLACGPWASLVELADRAQAFAVPRVVSFILIASALIAAAATLLE